jgi:hypothetical protein
MFERGRKRGTSSVREKCAAKMELLTALELEVDIEFEGERVTGLAWVAQLVERVLGKDEVTGSIPVPGSRDKSNASDLQQMKRRLDEEAGRKDLQQPGGGNSTVESHSSKVMVAGSNPVPRSRLSQ